MYRFMRQLYTDGEFVRWISFIHDLLEELEMMYVWENQDRLTMRFPHFKALVNAKLSASYDRWWRNELATNPKCGNYRLFKDTISFEHYIGVLNFRYVISLARFRCRANELPITKFLRDNNNRIDCLDLPLCSLCNDEIADEFHFVLVCSHFRQQRCIYVKRYFYNNPNILKFKALFAVKRVRELVNLAKFCEEIMRSFA